jgi:hypothetical protein
MTLIERIIFTRQLGDGVQVRQCQWFALGKGQPYDLVKTWAPASPAVQDWLAKQAQRYGKLAPEAE